jgi:RES domain-containing protein
MNGAGAAICGGRWNRQGAEVIYTAASRSLAILEVLAHYAVLPKDFLLTPIRIPDRVGTISIPDSALPVGWNQASTIAATQELAMQFYPSTAVLSVPSSIVMKERNYVLNPAHRDFRYIQFLASEPFQFDVRLKQTV